MANAVYTAEATSTGGGRDGRVRTSDGVLDVELKPPPALGGPGGATNPEQLFAAGYAACFSGAIGVVARREGLALGEIVIDSAVSLIKEDGDAGHTIAVRLDVVSAGEFSQEQLAHIVREAHNTCPYSKATRGNIPVELLAAGQPV
jgi:osmotically inducible protein OsmC